MANIASNKLRLNSTPTLLKRSIIEAYDRVAIIAVAILLIIKKGPFPHLLVFVISFKSLATRGMW